MKRFGVIVTLILVFLIAGIATGQGVNFSVSPDAEGLSKTGVAAQAAAESPANDVFIGGGCTNYVRLLHTLLGLKPGDDIDALCYQFSEWRVNFDIDMGEQAGWLFNDGDYPVVWHFSVDPVAQGRVETAVEYEVNVGSGFCDEPPNPNEAHGDYFFTSEKTIGTNELGADESMLGLAISPKPPHTGDDLNALDLDAPPIDRLCPLPETPLHPGDLFFSLAAGSPSLKEAGVTEDDILTPNGYGHFIVYLSGEKLGIKPGADLDGLFFDAKQMPFFSVKHEMTTEEKFPNANPGDILLPDGVFFTPKDGVADELIPARDLGLLDTDIKTRSGDQRRPDIQDDNLDALDAQPKPVQYPEKPDLVRDWAWPETREGECVEEGEGEPPIPHPGDLDINFHMVMSEAIAYCAGWQAGTNPMGYAIRAIFLWQNGEVYAYDAAQDPPMCWVPEAK